MRRQRWAVSVVLFGEGEEQEASGRWTDRHSGSEPSASVSTSAPVSTGVMASSSSLSEADEARDEKEW